MYDYQLTIFCLNAMRISLEKDYTTQESIQIPSEVKISLIYLVMSKEVPVNSIVKNMTSI